MQRIIKQIKEKNFQHLYLLYGEERYLKYQYTAKLKEALCENDEMNTHLYEGKDINVGEIIDLAETLPFLAERRVIFLKNSGLFKSGGDKLAEYLTNPNETTYFVFTESEIDKRTKLFKTLSANGLVVEFGTQDENTLKRWVAGILAKEGKKITDQTCTYFLTKTGTDMQNIQMELEKLICYCLDREVITNADIDAVCTTRLQDRIFEMVEYAAGHQPQKAINLYYDLLALKVEPIKILVLLSRQFNLMLQAKELKNKGFASKDIASKIGVPPFAVKKYLDQASKYKSSELRAALERCVSMDQAVKSGNLDGKMSVELLILNNA